MTDPVVEVTASGRAYAVPDQVVVGLQVEARAATVAEALRQGADAVERLQAVLDEAGVEERRTTGLQVGPAWDPQGGRHDGHLAGYGLRVVVRDLDGAGRLVQACAERVGDLLGVTGFGLSVRDVAPYERTARAAAVVACRARAEQLAAAAGATLGPLVRLVEGDGGQQRAAVRMSLQSGGAPVEPGQSEVVVAVTGTWRLLA